jgi:hypothetical protein
MVLRYINRLKSINTEFSKVKIAKILGISKQRLNYYFRTNKIPKKFLTKNIKRKITYHFRKATKIGQTKTGLKKIYKKFKFDNNFFNKVVGFYNGLNTKFCKAVFKFEKTVKDESVKKNKIDFYSKGTANYKFEAGGFEMFREDCFSIYTKYNIVSRDSGIISSTSVYFDGYVLVTFFI